MLRGKVKTVTDASGTTTYKYDRLGRLEKEEYPVYATNTSANSTGQYRAERIISYDGDTDLDNFNTGIFYTSGYARGGSYPYNIAILPVLDILTYYDANGNFQFETVTNTSYDGFGNPVIEEIWDSVGTANAWKTTKNYYDSYNNLNISVDPAGNETKMSYDSLSRPTEILDCYGNKYKTEYETQVSSNGTSKNKSYFMPGGTSLQQYVAENTNDIHGRVIEKKAYGDNGQTLTEKYKYDYLGNLTDYTDPNNNLNSYGATVHYEYDDASRLTGTRNAKNEYSSVGYDYRGNITSSSVSSQRQFTKTYDAQGRLLSDKDQLNKFQYYH
jgi:YD repeat-containing protein